MGELRNRGDVRGSTGVPRGGVRGSRQGKEHGCKREPRAPGTESRVGVTSDGAENAPRLRVTYGEDSKESVPPLKHRVETHTARAQGSPTPVPWRWRSRGARIRSHIDRGIRRHLRSRDASGFFPNNFAS